MEASRFMDILDSLGGGLYTGVPDSLLSPFIDALMDRYGISEKHIVAANEGAAVGLAAGHFLATSSPAVVYMQNSGIGNAVNPICSLLHEKVYSIPSIFVIGWRGEPGIKDEPQHVFQGEITLSLLECLEIPYYVISDENDDFDSAVKQFEKHLKNGRSVAFVVKKGSLQYDKKRKYISDATLSREDALMTILANDADKPIERRAVYVCTTGKLSREVFEIRERQGIGHGSDFLTVGSMGHSLMIAYGIALAKPERCVFCLDGDGAVLMHMGSLAVVGVHKPKNLLHVVINNGAHETVGGLPTVGENLEFSKIAQAVGYQKIFRVTQAAELDDVMQSFERDSGPVFIEIICNLSSRSDLGRPTTTPIENRDELMSGLG